MVTAQSLLTCRGICKTFDSTRALIDVDFTLNKGDIHGLIGENGAGKSTLTKLIAGVIRKDEGEIEVLGREGGFAAPQLAIEAGVITVHQDINLIDTMTVAENIFLNAEYKRKFGPGLDRGSMAQECRALLETFEISTTPQDLVGSLPTDLKKMIQLARAFRLKPSILLLDEPTSALTSGEVALATRQIRRVAGEGVGVLYISHYLGEVFDLCDQLTIFRDGRLAWSDPTSQTDLPSAIRAMIGANVEAAQERKPRTRAASPLLEIRGWQVGKQVSDIDLDLDAGEILGIGGLAGAGLATLARSLFGDPEFRQQAGSLRLAGQELRLSSPGDAISAGLALVTNDRHLTGVLPDYSLRDNLALPSLGRFSSRFGRLDFAGMDKLAQDALSSFSIKAAGPDAALKSLSGGNQQKVMLAKWFATKPRIMLLDEPTIGVDIGAKQTIKRLIREAADSGVGVILLTTELDDIVELADRAVVMFRGRIVAQFDDGNVSKQQLLQAAAGGGLVDPARVGLVAEA